MSFPYLDDLNDAQRVAVEHTDGPVMVLAGAGSGKTRVLTYRVAHLVNKGADPFRILSLTFTNKAAREMKERIWRIVGGTDSKNLWMGTFHSVFSRILRYESEKIGYLSNFTIYDTDDSRSLIKTILKELNLDDKVYKPNLVHNRISNAKNNLVSSNAYIQNSSLLSEDRQSAKPRLGEIYHLYDQRCFKSGAMDFDDLLFKTHLLLKNHPEALYKYQDKFKYVLVDEFQDTNFAQYTILKQLAARFENICVVGDDAQSIYGFRGANIENILNFKHDYPGTAVYKLEQNYRSTKNIVSAANSVIAKNRQQLHKEVWTANDEGQRIKVIRALTDNEEGMSVADMIFEIKNNRQAKNSAFAVLYRTNAQSRAMEEALRKRNIPYRIYGGLSFYKRKEIKDLLAYFRLTINHNDEEALRRIINFPARGIGDTTMERITLAANQANTSLWKVMENMGNYAVKVGAAHHRIEEFIVKIKSYASMLETHTAFDLGSHIAKSSGILKELYEDKTTEGLSRYENIQELLNGMKEFSEGNYEQFTTFLPDFPDVTFETNNRQSLIVNQQSPKTLASFMHDIALLTDADEEDKEQRDTVSLMTIHAAKGLEFPYVFVVGMEENLFPSQMSLNSRKDLEEERRLFYVALTRAEKQAVLSYSLSRYRWGNLTYCEPSRFIEEIDEKYLDISVPRQRETRFDIPVPVEREAHSIVQKGILPIAQKQPFPLRKMSKIPKNNNAFAPPPPAVEIPQLQVGMEVAHLRFGKGKVINIDGAYPNQKATVFFQGVGQKQLLLRFAKLSPVSS